MIDETLVKLAQLKGFTREQYLESLIEVLQTQLEETQEEVTRLYRFIGDELV